MCVLLSIIGHVINKAHHARSDGNPRLPYFRPEELGLLHEDFSFHSGKCLLRGSRYWAQGQGNKGLVIFFHGIGAGRSAYLKEIAALAREGYLVYAYDNTGSMESEGRWIGGLGMVGKDIKAFFGWLEGDERSRGLPRYAFGHSWGGYAAMLTSEPSYRVEKIVSIAGFTQPSRQYASFLRAAWMRKLHPIISLFLLLQLGKFGDLDTVPLLRKSTAKLLYIQGNQDKMVPLEAGMEDLRRRLGSRPLTEYVVVNKQGHNPYNSPRAEEYVAELGKKGLFAIDGPSDLAMDIERATEENRLTMQKVFDFLAA